MLSDDQVSAVESTAWFHVGHSPTMLLDTHLRIRAVNKAYETVTGRTHAELVGAALFDAFPDNAADPQNGGGATISSSIETVLRRRVRHVLGVQRYDLPDPADPGTFRYRVWTPVNSPLVIDGATVGVVHRNQDVTTAFPPVPTNGAEAPPQSAALDELARILGRSFPELPYAEILGIVAESYCVVARSLGRPDAGRTAELAALRAEVRAGRESRAGFDQLDGRSESTRPTDAASERSPRTTSSASSASL